MQRAARRCAIERARLAERDFRIEIDPRLDNVVARRNARDAIAHHGFARRLAGGDFARNLGGGEFVERALDLDVHGQFFPALPADVPAILPNTVPDIRPDPPG